MNFYTIESKWSDGTPYKMVLNLDKVEEIICEKVDALVGYYSVRIFFNSDGNCDKFTMHEDDVVQLAERLGLSPLELLN